MFLNKRAQRPIEMGTFCKLSVNAKNKLMHDKSYKRTGNISESTYHTEIHFADADVLYVIDDKVFDKEGLLRVIPISFHNDDYWLKKSYDICARKSRTFIVHKDKLNLITGDWKESNSVKAVHQHRVGALISLCNANFNLHKKSIAMVWENN
jgi:hypothetical protein